MTQPDATRVLYNAECPVCSFEIDHYRAYALQRDLPLRFDDLNGPGRAAWGVDADTAARRLHVLHEGRLHAGIDAFLVLWRQMPRYRWLARIVGLPGLRQAAGLVYDHALAPLIYRWHLRRKARN
ncbi:MAG: thiol-disulfide oxidoreductase DCC family protein [Paracoccaceae bacterium]